MSEEDKYDISLSTPDDPKRILLLPLLLGLLCAALGLLAVLTSVHIARADTLCVKPGGGSGCYASINTAITTANISDTICVATGIYTENVLITKTVTLEGGWNLTFTQRDPNIFTTTIRPANTLIAVVTVQGQSANWSAVAPTVDGFTITGAAPTTTAAASHERQQRNREPQHHHRQHGLPPWWGRVGVQRGAPLFANNRIQNNALPENTGNSNYGGGIDLEGTQATLTGNIIASNVVTSGYGGGVAVAGGGPVTLDGNTINDNSLLPATGTFGVNHGGGIALDSAEATLTNNIIASNVVTAVFGYGGGISVEHGGPITLIGNTVVSNSIGYGMGTSDLAGKAASPSSATAFAPDGTAGGAGGGVSLQYVTATLSSNLIQGNIAEDRYFGYGGGIYVYTGTVSLDHNVLQNNIAGIAPEMGTRSYGGGFYMLLGTATLSHDTVQNNIASNNNLGFEGGLMLEEAQATLDAVRVTNNHAYSVGGLAFVGGSLGNPSIYTITNSLVTNNSATIYGGAVADEFSRGTMTNNTFVNNGDVGIHTQSPLTLTNTIIMSHTIGISTTTAITETYNDFYANTTNAQGFTLDPTDLTVTPHLTADYHLSAGSPVIDAGTPQTHP